MLAWDLCCVCCYCVMGSVVQAPTLQQSPPIGMFQSQIGQVSCPLQTLSGIVLAPGMSGRITVTQCLACCAVKQTIVQAGGDDFRVYHNFWCGFNGWYTWLHASKLAHDDRLVVNMPTHAGGTTRGGMGCGTATPAVTPCRMTCRLIRDSSPCHFVTHKLSWTTRR